MSKQLSHAIDSFWTNAPKECSSDDDGQLSVEWKFLNRQKSDQSERRGNGGKHPDCRVPLEALFKVRDTKQQVLSDVTWAENWFFPHFTLRAVEWGSI